jgi:hypothetical protein
MLAAGRHLEAAPKIRVMVEAIEIHEHSSAVRMSFRDIGMRPMRSAR